MDAAAREPEPTVFRVIGPRRVFFAPVLFALNLIWFAWMAFRGVSVISPTNGALIAHGADFGPLVVEGEWWRILSAAFVHIGLIHIAVNMYALWTLGPAVERLFGNAAFLAIYLAGAIGCSLLSLYVQPIDTTAGASGAIFALAGALLAFVVAHKDAMPKAAFRGALRSMGMFLVVNLIIGLTVPNISLSGHAGGFVTGFVAALALDRDPARAPRLDLRRAARGAVLALALAGACALVFVHVRKDPEVISVRALMRAEETLELLRGANDDAQAKQVQLWERVEEQATAALANLPHSFRARELRAIARATLVRVPQAIEDCDVLVTEAEAEEAKVKRAEAENGEPADAEFKAALAEEVERARSLRGTIQLEFGNFTAARADFETLVKRAPKNGDSRKQLGHALLGLSEWAAAERALEGAQRADEPADVDVELWIARQMTGQRENADEELRKYSFSAREKSADAQKQFLVSVALGEEGERRGATSEELAQRVGVLRALRRVQTGSFDEARSEAQQVVAKDKRTWEAAVANAIVVQLNR